MSTSRSSWLAIAVAGLWVTFGSPFCNAQSENNSDPSLQQAAQFEQSGLWEKACDIYLRLLSKERTSIPLRQRYQACLRQIQLLQRLHDGSLADQILRSDFSLILKLYGEVLQKLHTNYVDRDRADWNSLFRYGTAELAEACADRSFQRQYLPTASPQQIEAFRSKLQDTWSRLSIESSQDAQTQAGEIALVAQQELGLKPAIVVLEFACGACAGLDEYTVFLTPAQLGQEYAALQGETVGIGADVALVAHQVTISQVVAGSPAAAAGIKIGDVLLGIDRQPIAGQSAESVNERLRGAAGSGVCLEMKEPGESKNRTLTLTRQLITVPSVLQAQILNAQNGIGYIQLASFQQTTVMEFDEALLQLKVQGLRGLILDLRGNPGGLFQPALDIAERFLSAGVVVTTQSQVRDQNRTYRANNPTALQLPLIVLIDGDTASAAEVVAGALKDHQRATLIGQSTFGKGSIQRVLQMDSAPSGIRVTLARFFSPRGKAYNMVGVTPHISVERSPMSLADPALELAIQQLTRLVILGQ